MIYIGYPGNNRLLSGMDTMHRLYKGFYIVLFREHLKNVIIEIPNRINVLRFKNVSKYYSNLII